MNNLHISCVTESFAKFFFIKEEDFTLWFDLNVIRQHFYNCLRRREVDETAVALNMICLNRSKAGFPMSRNVTTC